MENVKQENSNEFNSALWKLIGLRGITLLLVGLILLIFPTATLTVLVIIMGVYWLVDGIVTTYKSIQGRKVYAAWKWGIVTGVLGIIAGLVVLSSPALSTLLTTSFLVWFLGIAAIIYGLSGLITGFQLRKEIKGEWTMIIGGIFSIIFGIILISSPFISALVLIKTMGVIAIIGGITILFMAIGINKKAEQKIKE